MPLILESEQQNVGGIKWHTRELAARDETAILEELIGLATGLDNCLTDRQKAGEKVGR